MAFVKKVLILLAMASANANVLDQCPVIHIQKAEDCYNLASECWSPGEPDKDCPNNGLCCFNGCVNVCGIPPVHPAVPVTTETPCITEYETHTEDVPEEMCQEIPGMETCTTVHTSECHQVCEWVDRPETVTESVECCEKVKELVCVDLPCDQSAGSDETVIVESSVCKKREHVCYNVPEEVCKDETVENCQNVEAQKCQTIKKPTEWPTTTQECETKYVQKCQMVHRDVCKGFFGARFNPKLHHLLFKKINKFRKYPGDQYNTGCYSAPEKVCKQEPHTECRDVQTITIEYEDVEECHPITETVCSTDTVNKCEFVDKERCHEAEDVCENTAYNQTLFVPNNCEIADKKCHFVDSAPKCTEKFHEVEKVVQHRVCQIVCSPVEKHDCKRDEPVQECRTVFKTMKYQVPVLKC